MRIGLFAWGCLVASSLIMPSLLAAPPVMTGLPEGLKPRQRERIDLEYRLYDNVDFVVQARKLGTQIKLAEERLKSLEKLQQEHLQRLNSCSESASILGQVRTLIYSDLRPSPPRLSPFFFSARVVCSAYSRNFMISKNTSSIK